jgi:putative FmdB family regulatory protein
MPIHDYQCRKCRKRAELLVLRNQKPECPGCGSTDLQQLFSGSAAVSTTKTRERSMAGARQRAGAVKKEKDHAHSQYLAQHMKDHS